MLTSSDVVSSGHFFPYMWRVECVVHASEQLSIGSCTAILSSRKATPAVLPSSNVVSLFRCRYNQGARRRGGREAPVPASDAPRAGRRGAESSRMAPEEHGPGADTDGRSSGAPR